MIYLIDDKRERQNRDYNWTNEKLNKFHKYISPIYTLNELSKRSKEIFTSKNIILYHESFIDQSEINEDAIEKRNNLHDFANTKDNYLVYFSGSKSERVIDNNIAYLPVSVLYQNLEVFINKYAEGEIDLRYLLYGMNPGIEKELLTKLYDARDNTDEEESANINESTLFLEFSEVEINEPINNADIFILTRQNYNSFPDDFPDGFKKVYQSNKYEHIYLPLCFGSSLSDYNGLRLATHMRCTEGLNQISNIYIYGVVDGYNGSICATHFGVTVPPISVQFVPVISV